MELNANKGKLNKSILYNARQNRIYSINQKCDYFFVRIFNHCYNFILVSKYFGN